MEGDFFTPCAIFWQGIFDKQESAEGQQQCDGTNRHKTPPPIPRPGGPGQGGSGHDGPEYGPAAALGESLMFLQLGDVVLNGYGVGQNLNIGILHFWINSLKMVRPQGVAVLLFCSDGFSGLRFF